jgi:hypothetical protein
MHLAAFFAMLLQWFVAVVLLGASGAVCLLSRRVTLPLVGWLRPNVRA